MPALCVLVVMPRMLLLQASYPVKKGPNPPAPGPDPPGPAPPGPVPPGPPPPGPVDCDDTTQCPNGGLSTPCSILTLLAVAVNNHSLLPWHLCHLGRRLVDPTPPPGAPTVSLVHAMQFLWSVFQYV